MARMIPAHLSDDGAHVGAAERMLFKEFARQLGAEWTVLHSVHWLARDGGRSRDGEADFLLAHPRHGVLVLEVKGGAISRDGATLAWSSRDWGGEAHAIKDPFEQAERNMYALRDKLADAPETAGHAPWRLARSVAFPDILVGDADLGPNAPRALILDSGDLATLVRALTRAFDASPRGGGTAPGEAGVQALVKLLKPPVELARPGLRGEMLRQDDAFLRLTEQQYGLLDFLGGHRRVAIDGAAGSGKTLLALEQCRRLARQGFRVLFTCYNKALAGWARDALATDLGDGMALVTVENYHDLAASLVRRAGLPVRDSGTRDGDALARYFADELPNQLLDALATLPDRFDAIVVDEGQDFADTWWVTLEELLADPAASPLAIFYDENQRIYSTAATGAYPIPQPHHALPHNCRSTRHIHEAAMAFHHGDRRPTCRGPEGRPLVAVAPGDGGVLAALRRVLHDLTQTEGVPPEAIVVLSTRNAKGSVLAEGTKAGNLTLTWGEAGPGQLRVRTIHTFKGLESPIVILAEPERAHAASRDALLYVALSRAQHHVVVLGELPASEA